MLGPRCHTSASLRKMIWICLQQLWLYIQTSLLHTTERGVVKKMNFPFQPGAPVLVEACCFLCQPFLPLWASPPRFRREGQRRVCLLVFLAAPKTPLRNTKRLVGSQRLEEHDSAVCESDHCKTCWELSDPPSSSALQSSPWRARGRRGNEYPTVLFTFPQSGNDS